jgi:hypothetical protein
MPKNMHTGTIAGAGFLKDPLLSEIREYRDRYASANNYDVHVMGRDLRKREKRSGREFAGLSVHRNAK